MITTAPERHVLVAAATAEDAALIGRLLQPDFPSVATSSAPDRVVADFDRKPPDVLVLAFKAIADAQRYYLELYRQSRTIPEREHRTVLLCSKSEVLTAFDLCKRECFDDYVLYWPVTFDRSGLAMAVLQAIRHLDVTRRADPDKKKLTEMAADLAALQALIERTMTDGQRELGAADDALRGTADGVGVALQQMSAHLARRLGDLNAGKAVIGEVQETFKSLSDEHVMPGLSAASQLMTPARRALAVTAAEVRPRIESMRKAAADLGSKRPSILIVEDEETQREIYRHLLRTARYALTFASTGAEALGAVANSVPDLILMDMMLPDVSGLEVTRQLKRSPSHARIPVVMITAHSERDVVVESLAAGAVGFLVKPFTAQAFALKVAHYLRGGRRLAQA